MKHTLSLVLAACAFTSPLTAQCELPSITSPETQVHRSFGRSMDVDGDRMVIGSPFEGQDNTKYGRVYVYERVPGGWEQVQRINTPWQAKAFGAAVALDGDLLAIGAPKSDVNGDSRAGLAFVFKYDATQDKFVKVQRMIEDGITWWSEFGTTVDIAGGVLAVGAPGDGDIIQGKAFGYIYDPAVDLWRHHPALEPTSVGSQTIYGAHVEVDGDRVVVTNRSEWSLAGKVVVFSYDSGSKTWNEEDVVIPTTGAGIDEASADTVSIEGDTMAVGAPGSTAGIGAGTVSIFDWDPMTSTWVEGQIFTCSDGVFGSGFGKKVALEGNQLLVTALAVHEGDQAYDGVYLFERDFPGAPFVERYRVVEVEEFSFYGFWSIDITDDELLVAADHFSGEFQYQGCVYRYATKACDALGTAYCFGAGCPCGNDDLGGGCANSSGSGARLWALGSASVADDDLSAFAENLKPEGTALLFSGTQQLGGGGGSPLGDGLLCTGGSIRRLGAQVSDALGKATWGPGLISAGNLGQAGDTRQLQIWYRDPVAGPCGNGFNTSHGLELVLTP